MPRTLSFPPPSATTCPICAARLGGPRCDTCGASFTGPDGATLWRVDHDLFDLCQIRNDLVRRLLAPVATGPGQRPTAAGPPSTSPARSATPPAWASAPSAEAPSPVSAAASSWASTPAAVAPASGPGPGGGPTQAPAPPPTGPAGPPPSSAGRRRPRPALTAAEVLVGLGALSLVAAVAVFAAVAWSDLAAWAQGGLIVGLTGVVLAAAVASRRRHLLATAESLGAVAVALGLADVQVARVALDATASSRGVWAVGVAVIAAGALAVGRRTGIRVLALAGSALAFAPLVVAAGGGGPLAAATALALQAVVSGAVATRLADRPLDRAVVVVGAGLSWCGAVGAALVLATAGLGAEPTAHPTGPAVVLAALAVATIATARRLPTIETPSGGLAGAPAADDLAPPVDASVDGDLAGGRPATVADGVGGAGAALAFVPAVLVALGTGSPVGVLAVLAAEGVIGLALGRHGLTRGERAVAAAGGLLTWTGAAVGLLALAGLDLVDGDPATEPVAAALVLAALAVASIIGRRRSAGLGAAGAALALAPAVLLGAATGSPLGVVAVLAAQAIVALAVTGRAHGAARMVLGGGGTASWVAASAGAVALTSARPVGAPLVLAALAVASIALARRADHQVAVPLGAAGSALAAVPALLVALTSGSALAVIAVGAVQAVVALASAGVTRGGDGVLTEAERGVARGLGWALWVGSAAGALLLAVVAVGDASAEVDPRLGPLAVLALLAGASVVAGSTTRQAGLTAAGAGAAFVPVPLLVTGVATWTVLVAALVVEAVAAAVLGAVVGRGPTRTVLAVGGATTWVAAVVGAGLLGAAGWMGAPVEGPAGSVALLIGLAVVAVGAAVGGRWDREAASIGLGAAVVPVLGAVAVAAGGLGLDGWTAAVLVAAGALALGLGRLERVDPDRPWASPALVTLAVGAAAIVVPARATVAVVAALGERAITEPAVGAGEALADWLRPSLATSGVGVPGWAVVAQLVGAAGLVGAVAGRQRRAGRAAGAVLAIAALAVVPVAVGLTVAVAVAGLAAVVVGLAAAVRWRPRDPALLATGLSTVVLGTAVAVASAPWTVGWTVLVGVVAGGLAVEAAARRSPDAPAWVGAAVGVVVGGVALDAWVLGSDRVDALLAVAVAAAAVSPAAALLERRRAVVAAEVVDVLVALVLATVVLAAPAATGSLLALSPFVALVGVTAAGAAVRARRRAAWVVAAACAVVLAWLEAGRAEVELVEAYTLPLAAWALVVGAVAGRRAVAAGSWARFGVGLLAGVGPSTALALVDPDPRRTVAVVAVGAALAVWGAGARLQAPLAVGAAAVGALAVRHLGPVGVELPRYVAFAVAGLVLLAVGATFEQRRQDLRQARDAFVRLR